MKPDKGVIKVAEPVTNVKTDIMGYIPENVNLYPYLSGLENLDYFCKLAGFKYSTDKLSNFLSECGLQKTAHKKLISHYSKGMRQKVGIDIAYAKKAKIYLLDDTIEKNIAFQIDSEFFLRLLRKVLERVG